MSKDKMRGEFEAWAKPHLIYGDDSEDVEGFNMRMECAYYISTETQAAWEAWQASRAAVVVKLPKPDDGLTDHDLLMVAKGVLFECMEAIEDAGLKVRL